MSERVVPLIRADDNAKFGGKAANLAKMLQAGLPVPDGLALGLGAFDENGALSQAAKTKLLNLLSPKQLYAVRSSGLAEDAEEASWAGQFETFLDTKPDEVIARVEECHNSAKARAKAYASKQGSHETFRVAVVVQEMIQPDYAGVLFTRDPVTGQDTMEIEYVQGIGEQLVGGTVTPESFSWNRSANHVSRSSTDLPFKPQALIDLAIAVEALYGMPQDVEWVLVKKKFYLVQTRPITTLPKVIRQEVELSIHFLGDSQDLFYWGPSRATPIYMSDFMAAAEQFFSKLAHDPKLPNPPKTLVLFHDDKVVWLINAKAFSTFTRQLFAAYEKHGDLKKDVARWQRAVAKVDKTNGDADQLAEAQGHTLLPEFSLYGAEGVVSRRLARFDTKTEQLIWGAFTTPDKQTFLARIDQELLTSKDPTTMAQKYPWIDDGYRGVSDNAEQYFTARLKILRNNQDNGVELPKDRAKLAKQFKLTQDELKSLELVRGLAEFMDDRKAWMMRSRRYITKAASKVKNGWLFTDGEGIILNKKKTEELWERYVEFKASSKVVAGIVASNGGRHYINGKVRVVASPTDVVEDDLIVVVTSTSPSYVPLMRNARALITDHGGMMSHAAIVAREFNLPCIVGTKQATKTLKDGDKVVLDLVKGEVNK